MDMKFEIKRFPDKDQQKYLLAYTEGHLRIIINNQIFFDSDNVLLLELAITIKSWLDNLNKINSTDFIYYSMDYEEPILLINEVQDNLYKIDSIWKKNSVQYLTKVEIINSFRQFLDDLDIALKMKLSVGLNELNSNLNINTNL